MHTGALPAILISALFFTLLHPPSTFGFVFLMGIVVGMQFWLTGSLWPTMITHATYNACAQLDWRCLQGHWNPAPESLPQLVPGGIALLALATACFLILVLLKYQRAGAQTAPAPATSETRPRCAP
jgi:membrane protease YdiL (CAAX protease family)